MIFRKKRSLFSLLSILLVSLSLFLFFYYWTQADALKSKTSQSRSPLSKTLSHVIIDKNNLLMNLVNKDGKIFKTFPVAVGSNKGNKKSKGDLKTPEGEFPVVSIEDSQAWKYDFENDGLGPVDGAYGPRFIRLMTDPHQGIGIHGTHDNSTIGKRVSHGCVRMKNNDLLELVAMIKPGIKVVVLKDDVENLISQR